MLLKYIIHLPDYFTPHTAQIYLSKPIATESDNDTTTLYPKEARLRNLTWVWKCVGRMGGQHVAIYQF